MKCVSWWFTQKALRGAVIDVFIILKTSILNKTLQLRINCEGAESIGAEIELNKNHWSFSSWPFTIFAPLLLLNADWLTDWLDDLEELSVNPSVTTTLRSASPRLGNWIYGPIKNPLQTDDSPIENRPIVCVPIQRPNRFEWSILV